MWAFTLLVDDPTTPRPTLAGPARTLAHRCPAAAPRKSGWPRGALIVFADEHAGGKTGMDLSRLRAGSDRFTMPVALGGPPPSEDVALAANPAGKFVLAWRTATSTSRMTVITGYAGHLGARLRTSRSETRCRFRPASTAREKRSSSGTTWSTASREASPSPCSTREPETSRPDRSSP